MAIPILIAVVMYFFLLPARYEGERYAPRPVEKIVVLFLLTAPMIALLLLAGTDIFGLLCGSGLIYVLLIPVRMLFRMRIYPFEAWMIIASPVLTSILWLALPYFYRS